MLISLPNSVGINPARTHGGTNGTTNANENGFTASRRLVVKHQVNEVKAAYRSICSGGDKRYPA